MESLIVLFEFMVNCTSFGHSEASRMQITNRDACGLEKRNEKSG